MGIKLGAQDTSQHHYVKNLHSLLLTGMERLNKPWLWWNVAYSLSKQSKKFADTAAIVNGFIKQVNFL